MFKPITEIEIQSENGLTMTNFMPIFLTGSNQTISSKTMLKMCDRICKISGLNCLIESVKTIWIGLVDLDT